jgi:hypothetical protein
MKPDLETIARVKQAVERAKEAGEKAAREFIRSDPKHDLQGHILDACGYARVHTYDTGT